MSETEHNIELAPVVPWSISELTQQVRLTLQFGLPATIRVQGEVSNCFQARSGHCFLTLKDQHAQIQAVVWRKVLRQLPFELQDGQEIVAEGILEVYPSRGQYQLLLHWIEPPRGPGFWDRQFRSLHAKLSQEGLFAAERKRPIPSLPLRVALVTSPRGAAIRDFLEVTQRRWRDAEILLCPVSVQGETAIRSIVQAFHYVHQLSTGPKPCDVIVLIRGGGSVEDLWVYNEEAIARAIAAAPAPVITGVGHEIDITIADLVADLRALTPSEAAERLFPDRQVMAATVQHQAEQLTQAMHRHLCDYQQELDWLARQRCFQNPKELLLPYWRELAEGQRRLEQQRQPLLQVPQNQLQQLALRLQNLSPLQILARGYVRADLLAQSPTSPENQEQPPNAAVGSAGKIQSQTLAADGRAALSGVPLRSVHQVQPASRLRLHLADGQLIVTIQEVAPHDAK